MAWNRNVSPGEPGDPNDGWSARLLSVALICAVLTGWTWDAVLQFPGQNHGRPVRDVGAGNQEQAKPNNSPSALLWPESQQGNDMAYYLRPRAVVMEQSTDTETERSDDGTLAMVDGPADPGGLDAGVWAPGGMDRPAVRIVTGVHLTYYVDRGPMASGPWVFPGAAAVDPWVLPHGTLFRVVGDDVIRVALDTGGLVRNLQTDIWVPDDAAGKALIARFGDYVEIEIIQEP